MTIHFDPNRWNKLREDTRKWWNHELDRPLLQATLMNAESDMPEPEHERYSFDSFYDLSMSPEQVLDIEEYFLSTQRFVGDGFPVKWFNFGTPLEAAFMGAELENRISDETVWFEAEKKPPEELTLTHDEDNIWYERAKDLCEAAVERFDGQVQISMTSLGGNLDTVNAFLPGQDLLLDLYDSPEEIKRLTWEAHELWFKYFNEINDILQPTNPGYTAWTPIFSPEPYYILQCDFAYMISPDMFDEFVRPELTATAERLTNVFYHLDGVGQLEHLDSLLEIDAIDGVQWMPGAGKSHDPHDWMDVYEKIHEAGKLLQLWGGREELDPVADHLGTARGIVCLCGGTMDEKDEVMRFLEDYGAA